MAKAPNLEELRELYSTVVNAPLYDLGWQVTANETYLVCEVLDWLLSLADEDGRLVVEQPCEHGALEPHDWVCGAHDTDEKCPRQNCGAYLDFGEHCPQLHRKGDACWSASACGGGSRTVVWPT